MPRGDASCWRSELSQKRESATASPGHGWWCFLPTLAGTTRSNADFWWPSCLRSRMQ